jgi:DnaA-homolog protein
MADLFPGMTAQTPLSLMQPPAPNLRDGVEGRNTEALTWLAYWMRASGAADACSDPSPDGQKPVTISGDEPGQSSDALSLLLWGTTGAGKTFWMQAWASQPPPHMVFDLRDQEATNRLITAIHEPQTQPVWMIDNIDAAAPQAQQALFALFIRLQQERHEIERSTGHGLPPLSRIIATASAPPGQLSGKLRDDLRTRLGQGLVFELHEMSDTEKMQALRDRAFRLGWMASATAEDYDHLFAYMLARLPRQLGMLMQLLLALDARALSLKRAVTLPLMRSLLDENLSLF